MSRKCRIKEIRKSLGDGNVNDMFEKMIGVKDAESEIIIPKLVLVRNKIKKFHRVLYDLCNLKNFRKDFPNFNSSLDEIMNYIENLRSDIIFDVDDKEENESKFTNSSKSDATL